jgi:hypothetical protein
VLVARREALTGVNEHETIDLGAGKIASGGHGAALARDLVQILVPEGLDETDREEGKKVLVTGSK